MMGPSHALSGAAGWLVGSLALQQFAGIHQTPVQLAVGTAMCAGGALLPDLDLSGRVTTNQGGATVARTFGVVSLFLAECIEKLSLGIYTMTRGSRDRRRDNGHRTFTHTLPFNVGVGFGVFELCLHFGKPAVLSVLFFTFAMALRGLFEKWAERAGWVIVTLSAVAATFAAYETLPAGRGYPILGIALGVGGLIHILGDMLTSHGCPVLWPIPTGRGRMWRCFGLPHSMAVKVGGKVEVVVLRTAFTVVSIATAGWMLYQPLLQRFNIKV
ncbi:metal-dependent hydrolase [Planosporangium sp. 12N6]|uniref:metal-dependent hydrolase n=1 Tax=Planosporangium spinosum TaxID=3402278 RepID=UPI003CEB9D32